MALVFPMLVAVLFGIIDGGRLMGSRVMLSQAAIAAARQACLSSTTGNADLDQAAQDAAPMLTGVAVDWPSFGCTGACGTPPGTWPKGNGDQITVTVQYNFMAGYFSQLSKTLSQTSRVVCE